MNPISLEEKDMMTSVARRYCVISRLRQVTTALVGFAFVLALLLHVTPALAQSTEVVTFSVGLVDTDGNHVANDCLRFSLDGLFWTDVLAGIGMPVGLWNVAEITEGLAFTAYMSTIIDVDGELVPATVSFGGLISETGDIDGAIDQTGGGRLTFSGLSSERCSVSSVTNRKEGENREFGY